LIEIPVSVAILCLTYLYAQRVRLRAEFDAKQAATSIAQLRAEFDAKVKDLTERTEEHSNRFVALERRIR